VMWLIHYCEIESEIGNFSLQYGVDCTTFISPIHSRLATVWGGCKVDWLLK
jgi:hypothetical protein